MDNQSEQQIISGESDSAGAEVLDRYSKGDENSPVGERDDAVGEHADRLS